MATSDDFANEGLKFGIHKEYTKMFSVICHQEKARRRTTKWLMGLRLNIYNLRKLKMHKCVPESFIRSKDVSSQKVRNYIEKNCRLFGGNLKTHHVVKDYLQLFDMYTADPAMFFKTFSSALNNLRTDVLDHVARIITEDKIMFDRTRRMMIKVIEESIPKVISQSVCQNHRHEVVRQLSLIFRDPVNFQNSNLILITPFTPSLLMLIRKVFMDLGNLSSQCLDAMERRIRGVRITPKLSPVFECRRDRVINRLWKQCNRILVRLVEGDELPKPLAKALSAISLHNKQVSRRDDIPTTEFFPFSPEAEELQTDILKAIWSIPKMKNSDFKILQHLLDPNSKLKPSRRMVVKYLTEYLFESSEIDVPKSFQRIVAFICRKSGHQTDFCKKQDIEEELEVVLNISSQLKQIAWDSFENHRIEEDMEDLNSGDDICDGESDDIVIDGNDNCSVLCEHGKENSSVYLLNVEAEGVGESQDPFGLATNRKTDSAHQSEIKDISDINTDNAVVKYEQSAEVNDCNSLPRLLAGSDSIRSSCKRDQSYGNACRYRQDICDETSLLAHRLIGHVIKQFEDAGKISSPEEGYVFLVHAVEELVPSFPKSDLERVKTLMDIPE